jgi:hypothetical protein
LANGFTEFLDPNLPEHTLRQLAETDFSVPLYLVLGLLAAIISWVNKRKQAAKLEQSSHAAPTQRSQRPAQAGKPTGWLARLEQLAEAQLPKTDQELERQYAGNYELESVETPMIIPADDLPPMIGTTARQTRRTRETPKHSAAVHASRKARQPTPSPVYNSPIYTGNIAHRIGTDTRTARQAVVGSIILGQPRSLERPEQITRY